jgi:hypothetical protein
LLSISDRVVWSVVIVKIIIMNEDKNISAEENLDAGAEEEFSFGSPEEDVKKSGQGRKAVLVVAALLVFIMFVFVIVSLVLGNKDNSEELLNAQSEVVNDPLMDDALVNEIDDTLFEVEDQMIDIDEDSAEILADDVTTDSVENDSTTETDEGSQSPEPVAEEGEQTDENSQDTSAEILNIADGLDSLFGDESGDDSDLEEMYTNTETDGLTNGLSI